MAKLFEYVETCLATFDEVPFGELDAAVLTQATDAPEKTEGTGEEAAPLGALEAGLSFLPSFDQTLRSRIGGPRAALGLPEGGFASETSASDRRADRTARRGEDDDEKAKRVDG